MTDTPSPRLYRPRVTVLPVQPGDPPFRIVEIDGEVVGTAIAMTDVVVAAAEAGIRIDDLDDPDEVRWVGGGKLTWKPRGD
ncbi:MULTISPECIES: hypothetical protein [unclassified Streptomyces]|uniref:hypothetical protein n=1 Tax=Streptomyces TaxID=1883 RepID=UPI0001C1AB6C|nr:MULTISPECIES: hypothetical protein [unclassified Streptomyces]AEN12913.1 conserved hypothetical protein [Streptomyces sp. SirexAA-E]MYR66092.1 hypothetical protein [Streptomyces sp. SID4939]MYS00973.1 hypothetical protein [Streptomyces sp. SID4940]MYT65782.1 hypothetical protein [Streptomyces sp. SID8357]MYT84182.1 hypothetical protein [Streptomyces sp. SID8360]